MPSLPRGKKIAALADSPVLIPFIAFFFLTGLLLLVPAARDALLAFAGRVGGKSLLSSKWKEFLIEYGGKLLLASLLLAVHLWRRRLSLQQSRQQFLQEPAGRLALFDRGFLLISSIAWILFTGSSVLLHEPWRDELQAWSIARACGPAQIFHEMRYEGHFVPWFYLFIPFAKLGFPLLTLNLVSFAIMAACTFLVLFKSPFGICARTAFVFSVPMAYYYPVVSRCYCLFALCAVALALVYGRRTERPFLYALLLGLLANSHAYAEGLVAVLTVDLLYNDILLPWHTLERSERRRRLAALALVFLFVLLAFCQVAPALSSSTAASSRSRMSIDRFFDVFIQVFLALDLSSLSQFTVLFLAVLALHLLSWHRRPGLLLVLGLSLLWMLVFAATIYGASIPSRAWMWLFVLLLVLWQMAGRGRNAASVLLALISLASFNPAVNARDWTGEFSTAKATAAYIKEHVPAGERIYLPYAHANYSMLCFAPGYDYRSLETGEGLTFFSWSREREMAQYGDMNACIRDRFTEGGTAPLLVVGLNNAAPNSIAGGLVYGHDVLLESRPSISGESFTILRVYDGPAR